MFRGLEDVDYGKGKPVTGLSGLRKLLEMRRIFENLLDRGKSYVISPAQRHAASATKPSALRFVGNEEQSAPVWSLGRIPKSGPLRVGLPGRLASFSGIVNKPEDKRLVT
jgi:hypothetical protein